MLQNFFFPPWGEKLDCLMTLAPFFGYCLFCYLAVAGAAKLSSNGPDLVMFVPIDLIICEQFFIAMSV